LAQGQPEIKKVLENLTPPAPDQSPALPSPGDAMLEEKISNPPESQSGPPNSDSIMTMGDDLISESVASDLTGMIDEACDLNLHPQALFSRAGNPKAPCSIDHILFTHKKILNFSLIDIEPCFFDFYQNNLYRKCEKCDSFPVQTDLSICLLCNYICCIGHCGTMEDKKGTNGKL
jgi:hypothetical protein